MSKYWARIISQHADFNNWHCTIIVWCLSIRHQWWQISFPNLRRYKVLNEPDQMQSNVVGMGRCWNVYYQTVYSQNVYSQNVYCSKMSIPKISTVPKCLLPKCLLLWVDQEGSVGLLKTHRSFPWDTPWRSFVIFRLKFQNSMWFCLKLSRMNPSPFWNT